MDNPTHGNYHGYYNKRPSVNDLRLARLPEDMFRGKTVLDVGCNEGWVSCEIAQSWGANRVVGVDIDETLIRAAWHRRLSCWSLQQPLVQEETGSKRKRTKTLPKPAYFPVAFEQSLGSLPIPSSTSLTKTSFPHNLSFRTIDWVHEAIPEDSAKYDVIIALSISKWIHLNDGDNGIRLFFQRVKDALQPGGWFVLEPQAWDTYRKAKRMDPMLKATAQTLQLRPEDFSQVLQELGFDHPQSFGEAGEGGFRRPVDAYMLPGT